MKIHALSDNRFLLEGTKGSFGFNLTEGDSKEVDVLCYSKSEQLEQKFAKKTFSLPGDFEVSGILIKGVFENTQQKNVLYKVIIDEIVFAFLSDSNASIEDSTLTSMGENIDVLCLLVGQEDGEKSTKKIIELIDPRIVFLSGDMASLQSCVSSMGASPLTDNPMKLSRTQFSNEKTEIFLV